MNCNEVTPVNYLNPSLQEAALSLSLVPYLVNAFNKYGMNPELRAQSRGGRLSITRDEKAAKWSVAIEKIEIPETMCEGRWSCAPWSTRRWTNKFGKTGFSAIPLARLSFQFHERGDGLDITHEPILDLSNSVDCFNYNGPWVKAFPDWVWQNCGYRSLYNRGLFPTLCFRPIDYSGRSHLIIGCRARIINEDKE